MSSLFHFDIALKLKLVSFHPSAAKRQKQREVKRRSGRKNSSLQDENFFGHRKSRLYKS